MGAVGQKTFGCDIKTSWGRLIMIRRITICLLCVAFMCFTAGCETTTSFEDDNTYELIDAGSSIECEYWFPVNAYKPVKIQILNPDGEDTVMAELEYIPSELMDDF